MKIKKILVISITIFLVFIIYLTTLDKKIYLVSLSTNNSFDLLNTVDEKKDYNKIINNYLNKKEKLEKNVNNLVESKDRITDLLYKIDDNYSVDINGKKQTIKNALIKADLLTVDIGINELQSKILLKNNFTTEVYDYIDELINDYKKLLIVLREYCKEDIIVIGYYSSDYNYEKYINYFNKKLAEITNEYKIIFIDTNKLYENNNLSYDKEEVDVATEIIKIIEEVLLK